MQVCVMSFPPSLAPTVALFKLGTFPNVLQECCGKATEGPLVTSEDERWIAYYTSSGFILLRESLVNFL